VKNINKGFFFIILTLFLGAILYFRNDLFLGKQSPRMVDRLPHADVLARVKFLDLSKELNAILFKYKLPIREFAAPDFLLSQAKNSGLDVQKNVYIFASKDQSEWGGMVSVTDSAKIIDAVDRFRKNTQVLDSSENGIRIFHFPEMNLSVSYENSYLLIYSGNLLKKRLAEIHDSEYGNIRSSWKKFLALKKFNQEKLVVFLSGKPLKDYGFDYALFAHDNDTLNVNVKFYLASKDALGYTLKTNGKGLPLGNEKSKSIELHLNKPFLPGKSGDALKKQLVTMGKKIGFPTLAFLDAWEGDLSFREGGTVKSKQRIIVSELDEDFNVREVTKFQDIEVLGYSIAFNMNEKGPQFINTLFQKGLLRTEENKLRFLFSPLLTMRKMDSYYFFTSSLRTPKLVDQSENHVQWNYEGSPFRVDLKKASTQGIEGTLMLPAKQLILKLQKRNAKKSIGSIF